MGRGWEEGQEDGAGSALSGITAHRLAFRGQLADETALLVLRSWWLKAALSAWPAALGIVTLLLLFDQQITSDVGDPLWSVAEVIVGIVTLVLLARWALSDGLPWWFTLYVVTDQRVIESEGVIERKMSEIPLPAVQEVYVEALHPLEWLCGIGRVTVVAAGRSSRITFRSVRFPRRIVEIVVQAQQQHAATIPPAPEIPDPAIRQVLDTLARPSPLPDPESLAPAIVPRWPLSRAVQMPLTEGEKLLGIVSRHWWALAQREARPLALLGAAISLFVVGAWLHMSLQALCLAILAVDLFWGLLQYLAFADDVYLITTQRIIDVERSYLLIPQKSISIEYTNIQEATSKIPSPLAYALGFGNVVVRVAGDGEPVIMGCVPQPDAIARSIERNRTLASRRDKAAALNDEKSTMKEWFAAVVGELVVAAPDLRNLTLEEAIERSQSEGLRLMVFGDGVQLPGVPAGLVVSQSPLPGSRALRGGDITVVLSRM
jgi:membrane protein YdbS with pleckstrin-like domain